MGKSPMALPTSTSSSSKLSSNSFSFFLVYSLSLLAFSSSAMRQVSYASQACVQILVSSVISRPWQHRIL